MEDDSQELGGNIELIGFRDVDSATMIVLKKIVGNTVKKYAGRCTRLERFSLSVKKVHEREKSEIYELRGKLSCDGKHFYATTEDYNLFFAVDKCLKRLETEAFGK
jgi:hypothetical protein